MKGKGRTKLGLLLNNWIYPLRLPLPLSKNETWKPFILFNGITEGLSEISCHASALSFGHSPHPPHSHKEEELLILLSGNLNIILPDRLSPDKIKSIPIEKGQFVYYPSYFAHTLQAKSRENANYLMFKWYTGLKNTASVLTSSRFNMFEVREPSEPKDDFYSQLLFEGPTDYLKKLHCHISTLMPGAGYKPHSDNYDVVIIVLEGKIETIGQQAEPYDVIFYSAGEPHGIYNSGTTSSRYLVFEFHTSNKMLISGIFNIFAYYFTRVTDRDRWKRKLRKILNLLHTRFKLF